MSCTGSGNAWLLSAHFQAYCRGLHSDSTQMLVEASDPGIGAVLDTNLSFRRQLDSGNAQPGALDDAERPVAPLNPPRGMWVAKEGIAELYLFDVDPAR